VGGRKGGGTKGQIVLVDLEKTRKTGLFPPLVRDLLAARDLIQLLQSLPVTVGGESLEAARREFLSSYLERRAISPRRRRRIEWMIGLYGPQGTFVQGRTVVGSLFARLKRTKQPPEEHS